MVYRLHPVVPAGFDRERAKANGRPHSAARRHDAAAKGLDGFDADVICVHNLIIADDLTGALAVGGLLAPHTLVTVCIEPAASALQRMRPGSASHPGHRQPPPWTAGAVDGDVALAVNSGTRNLAPNAAYATIRRLLRSVDPSPPFVAHRVDSTGRGNLAAGTQAILEARPRSVALCVLAYPAAHRTCVGGRLCLHGVPVDRSAAGVDRLNPVQSSDVPSLLGGSEQFRGRVLPLDDLRRGHDVIRARLATMLTRAHGDWRNRVFIADAVTDDDIEAVAAAAAAVEADWVPTDPGPFTTAFWVQKVGGAPPARPRKLPDPQPKTWLLVVGSAHAQTHAQAEYALRAWRESGGSAVVWQVEHGRPARPPAIPADRPLLVVIETALPTRPVGTAPARRMAALLGAAGRDVADRVCLAGLLVSGGDTATAVLTALGAQHIDVEGLVEPLVPCGRLADGPFAGTRVVTKGGLVGEPTIFWRALAQLGATSALVPTRRV